MNIVNKKTGAILFTGGKELNSKFYRNWYEVEEDAEKRDGINQRGAAKATAELLLAYSSDARRFSEIEAILLAAGLSPEDPEAEALFADFVDENFGTSDYYKKQEKEVENTVSSVSRLIIALTLVRLGREPEDDIFFDKSIREYTQESLRFYGVGTRRYIKDVFRKTRAKEVVSVEDMMREIRMKYQVRRYVARTIARTAVGHATGAAELHTFMVTPEVSHVMWVTRGDNRVRPTHRAQANAVRIKGHSFPNGCIQAPCGWNCRCKLVPLTQEEVTTNKETGQLEMKEVDVPQIMEHP